MVEAFPAVVLNIPSSYDMQAKAFVESRQEYLNKVTSLEAAKTFTETAKSSLRVIDARPVSVKEIIRGIDNE